MWIGAMLICVGILVLLDNMGVIRGDVWNYIWPLVLIFVGIGLIFKRSRRYDRFHTRWEKEEHPPDQPGPPRA